MKNDIIIKTLEINNKKIDFVTENLKGFDDLYVETGLILRGIEPQKCKACNNRYYTKEFIHICPNCGYSKNNNIEGGE